jgi:type IV pilus assembly protein PilB
MIDDAQIEQIISKVGVIDNDTLAAAKAVAASKQRPLADILLEKNLLKPNQLGQLISNIYHCSFVDVTKENIDDKTLQILPELVAARQGAIVFRNDSEGIKVAMTDPQNYELKKLLEKKTGAPVTVYYTLPSLLTDVLGRYRKSIQDEFEEMIKLNVARVQNAKPEDLSIIKIVDNLIAYAHHNAASDIHIEPQKKDVTVRFRIDGILHDVLVLPKEIHELVVARIKILSRLRIDEHRSSQDGKISMEIGGIQVDIRVSILPTVHGEKVVMRLLSANNKEYTLEDLGFSARDLKLAREAITKPHGMILSTGPTGSGKSTTLYALVQLINSREINISTIEDPVEYDMAGVNQIQVDPKTNLTFAAGLRSLLRQDPDVIMVGEIRDEETAGIAVNSAMTGHLVLSSLHTNVAPTVER